MRELQIAICSDISQKMPETDRLLASSMLVIGQQSNGFYTKNAMDNALMTKFSYIQSTKVSGIDRFGKFGEIRFDTAAKIIAARQQISTLSFVDSDFAQEAEFMIPDDLSALNLPNGTNIT